MRNFLAFLLLIVAAPAWAQGGPGPTPGAIGYAYPDAFFNSGGLLLPKTVPGGSKGVGTINATGLFVNGVSVLSGALPAPSTTARGGVYSSGAVAHQFATGISTLGVLQLAQPTIADLALSLSGSSTVVATATGTLVTGHCVSINAGNFVDAGGSCTTGGGGTVSSGTTNQLAYYPSAGTVVGGLVTAANGVLVTNGSGAPLIATTLPSGLTVPSPTLTGTVGGSGVVPNAALVNPSISVAGVTCTLGASCAIPYSALSSGAPTATSSVLGLSSAGTGLGVTGGAYSVLYGTSAGQAAQGNDSRITGALQASTAASTYLTLTGSASGLTGFTSSQITTALGFTPAQNNASTTVSGVTCTLGSSCAIPYSGLSSGAPSATTSVLGLVTYGTASGTAAQGNDSRITGALQSTATSLPGSFLGSSLTSVGTLTGGATGSGFTVNLGASTIAGLLAPANGGCGVASLSGIHKGNGASPCTAAAASDVSALYGYTPLSPTGSGASLTGILFANLSGSASAAQTPTALQLAGGTLTGLTSLIPTTALAYTSDSAALTIQSSSRTASSIYGPQVPGTFFYADGVRSVVVVPSTATATNTNGFGYYVSNQSVSGGLGQNAVGIFGTTTCEVNGCQSFGINPTLIDGTTGGVTGTGTGRILVGAEFDISATQSGTIVQGIALRGSSTLQPAFMGGFSCGANGSAKWGPCFYISDGSATVAASWGALATSANSASQPQQFRSYDGSAVLRTSQIQYVLGAFNFSDVALANYIGLAPAATGGNPTILVSGTDASINMVLQAKGSGQIIANGPFSTNGNTLSANSPTFTGLVNLSSGGGLTFTNSSGQYAYASHGSLIVATAGQMYFDNYDGSQSWTWRNGTSPTTQMALSSTGNLSLTGGITATTANFTGNIAAAVPSATTGLSIGYNYSNGGAESDFFNDNTGSSISFGWYQKLTTSTAAGLMTLYPSGYLALKSGAAFQVGSSSGVTKTCGATIVATGGIITSC